MKKILRVSATDVRPLRDKILRANMAPGSIYPGDDNSDTCHLAAYQASDIVAVGTVCSEQFMGCTELNAWRIRGMATLPEYQEQSLGRGILKLLIAHAVTHGADAVWCQARTKRRSFYRAFGFVIVGEEYVDPGYPDVNFIKMIQYISKK